MEKQKLKTNDKDILFRLLKTNFKKYWHYYIKAIFCMIVIGISLGATTLMMKYIVNEFISFQDTSRIWIIAAIVASIFVVKGFATYLQSIYLSRAGNHLIAEQQQNIYNHLVKQDLSFFSKNASSDLLLRIINSAQSSRTVIDLFITTYIRDVVSLISLVAAMIWTNYWLTLIVFFIAPTFFLIVRFLVQKIKNIVHQEISSLGEIIQLIQETSLGIQVIKTFRLENYMKNRMNKVITDVREKSNAISKLQAITSPVMETVVGISIALVIGISGTVILHTHGNAGDLMTFLTSILLAYEPARRITNGRIQISAALVNVKMMFQILDHPILITEEKNAKELGLLKNEISFEKIFFSYTKDKPLIENLSFKIPAKKMTALVGPSGSGKSTIINLLMRLYDPIKGRILFDNQDIRFTTLESLRNQVSYVGQDIFLFKESIFHNIAVGKEGSTEADVIQAAKYANAHEFIMELPDGYNTKIFENGVNLSGGQKQRLAIARAILRDSQILLFDEATSALDAQTEAVIQDALDHLIKNRTSIMIAHKFQSILKADYIIVMQEGSVIEQGTQNQLLQKNGLFQKLYNLQFQNKDKSFFFQDFVDDHKDNFLDSK